MIPVKGNAPYATYITSRVQQTKYHSGIGQAKNALIASLKMWWDYHTHEDDFPTMELYKYDVETDSYNCVLTVGTGMTVEKLQQDLKQY